MSNNICNLVPAVKGKDGKLDDSKLFLDLLAHTNNSRENTTKLYAATKTDSFKSWAGDWQTARKEWLAHKFDTLEDAQLHYKVGINTDSKGEPILNDGQFTNKDGTTMSPTHNGNIRKNSINNYINNVKDSQSETKLLQIHKEALDQISDYNKEVKAIKEEKQQYLDYLKKNNIYDANDPKLKEYDNKIEAIISKSEEYSSKLKDLENGNILDAKDDYNSLAHLIMNRVENTPGYNLKSSEGIKNLSDDYNILRMLSSINSLHGEKSVLPLETSNRAIILKDGILQHIEEYVKSLTPFVNLKGKDEDVLSMDMLTKPENDVNTIEMLFRGFGDYPRLEAQLIHSRVLKGKSIAELNTVNRVGTLLAHMQDLKQWANDNIRGMKIPLLQDSKKLKEAYNLLTEVNHNGRLDLVKPFNKFYYRDLNNAFKQRYSDDEDEVKVGKTWLKNNYHKIVGMEDVPAKYQNSKYQYIFKVGNEPLGRFYSFFKSEVAEGYKLLPPWIENKNNEKIPSLLSDKAFSFLQLAKDMKDQASIRPIWEAVKHLLIGNGTLELYDENGKIRDKTRHTELTADTIRLRMVGEIEADKKSTDLGNVLRNWISFTQDYHQMSEVLPEVRMIQAISSSKEYKDGNLLSDGTQSNMYKAINMYVDARVLGNDSKKWGKLDFMGNKVFDDEGKQIGEQTYYLTDWVKSLISYTRMLNLGLNPFSAVNNIMIGLSNDLTEASGHEYFRQRDIIKASNTYFGQMMNSNSKYNKIVDFIQPLQELGEYHDLKKVPLPSVGKSIKDKMFFMQFQAEKYVQSITMIAYLNHEKVATSKGQKSLWDLFSVKDGKLSFDHELAGFKFDQNILNTHRETIKKINRTVRGNYSKDNSSVYEPYVGYQAAMLFNKWIPESIASRFQGQRYDYYSGRTLEGRYRTLYKTITDGQRIKAFAAYPIEAILGMKHRLDDVTPLKPHEVANMRKNLMGLAMVASFTLMRGILAPPVQDDKKKWYRPTDYTPDYMHLPYYMGINNDSDFKNWNSTGATMYKYLVGQAHNGAVDADNFYNPSFYSDLSSRFKLIQTTVQLGQVFESLINEAANHDDNSKTQYQTGAKEGNNKAVDKTLNAIPVARQINKAFSYQNQSYDDLSGATWRGK